VHTNQRLNLSKLWEGLRKVCQGFKPDSGNPTVRDYRGASENVRHGGNVNPPAIERAGPVTPHLKRGASDFYPSEGHVEHGNLSTRPRGFDSLPVEASQPAGSESCMGSGNIPHEA
jgi:hypothetical protein